jgi:anti-sigma factor RsiW
MNHPDELPAQYVQAARAHGQRAVVERHLASCTRCRDQVAMAGLAGTSLAVAPDAEAPAAIGERAIALAGAGQTRPASGSGTPSWYRWGGVAAAIAAAILLLVIALPNVGSKREAAAPAAAPSEADAGSRTVEGPATSIESQDTNYDAQGVQALAQSYAGEQVVFDTAKTVQVPAAEGSHATAFDGAAACLGRAASGGEGQLVRLIEARYQGTPAYFGVYLTGPGADQPADGVRVLVVPRGDCSSILTSTWTKL